MYTVYDEYAIYITNIHKCSIILYYTLNTVSYYITTLTLRRVAGKGVLLSSSGDEKSGLIGGCGESV